MGYTLTIGNAELESSWDTSEYGECYAKWGVKGFASDDAPQFAYDLLTKNTSERSPSYSGWAEFCRATGLVNLFFGTPLEGCDETRMSRHDRYDDGLLSSHPGCAPIKQSTLDTVKAARLAYEAKHPGAIAGFDYSDMWPNEKDDGVRGRDPMLARLIWLEWWMQWVLTNCERPAMQNS